MWVHCLLSFTRAPTFIYASINRRRESINFNFVNCSLISIELLQEKLSLFRLSLCKTLLVARRRKIFQWNFLLTTVKRKSLSLMLALQLKGKELICYVKSGKTSDSFFILLLHLENLLWRQITFVKGSALLCRLIYSKTNFDCSSFSCKEGTSWNLIFYYIWSHFHQP